MVCNFTKQTKKTDSGSLDRGVQPFSPFFHCLNQHIDRMLKMMSDVLTNVGKHDTSNTACLRRSEERRVGKECV